MDSLHIREIHRKDCRCTRRPPVEQGVKLDLPNYYSKMDPEAFLEWLTSCDSFYSQRQLSVGCMVQFATAKLKGSVYMCWQHHQEFWGDLARVRSRLGTRWRKPLWLRFLHMDYAWQICCKFHRLVQGWLDECDTIYWDFLWFDHEERYIWSTGRASDTILCGVAPIGRSVHSTDMDIVAKESSEKICVP